MGLGRFLWRMTGIGRTIDTLKNIVEEDSIIEGVKRTSDEFWHEDNPITSRAYKSGEYDGKKQGYAEASDKYEKKLLHQAEEFLKQKKDFQRERDEYEALLDEYEKEIDMLNEKVNKTEREKEYLLQLMQKERELRKLSK